MRKPPCILHPPPPPEPPSPPGSLPQSLSAMARWVHPTPPSGVDLAYYIDLHKLIGLDSYAGENPAVEPNLDLTVTRTNPAGIWEFALSFDDPVFGRETLVWSNVTIDPAKPFDSGLLQEIVTPGSDFRELRVLE